MKEIELTQGKVALIEDEDFERLNQVKWCAHKDGNIFYATRALPRVNGKQKHIQMHHIITGCPPQGFVTDHKNGDGLDNRHQNLRFVTRRQNGQNQKHRKQSSQYPGVCWDKKQKRWLAQIRIEGKSECLGRFLNEKEAFEVYKEANNKLGEKLIEEWELL